MSGSDSSSNGGWLIVTSNKKVTGGDRDDNATDPLCYTIEEIDRSAELRKRGHVAVGPGAQ